MKKIKNALFSKYIFKIFYIIFFICFSSIFISSIFRDGSVYYKLNPFIFISIAIVILLLWYYIYKLIDKYFEKISNKQKLLLYIITFSIIIGLIIYLGIILEIPLGWDYDIVYSQARSYALTKDRLKLAVYPEYFQYFPNNISIFLTEVVLFKIAKLFGITDFLTVMLTFNGLIIFLTILFIFLYCYRKLGCKKAYFSLIVCLFFIPLYAYLPIFYSDTFSLLFGVLLLYVYSFFDLKKINTKHNILLFILFSILLLIGIKYKMTVIFVFGGIIMDFFYRFKLKKTAIFTVVICVIFGSLNLVYNFMIKDHFKINSFGNIPITHWIMMGIEDPTKDNSNRNSYGGYNYDDYQITESYKTGKGSIPRHISEIKKRLKAYGFFGYIDYLDKKAVNIWGDGSYFSAIKLNIDNKNKSNIVQRLLSGEDDYRIIIYIEQGVQLAFMFILIFSSLYCYIKSDEKGLLLHVPIFLIMLFLLVWEGRSRYLYNYIPLFILIVVIYIDKLIEVKSLVKFRRLNHEKGK